MVQNILSNKQFFLNKIMFSMSVQKMNLMANLIRGQKINAIMPVLKFTANKGSRSLYKLLSGVVKNIGANNLNTNDFILSKVVVNRETIYKRVIFRSKSRSDRIRKRRCSLDCVISQIQIKKV